MSLNWDKYHTSGLSFHSKGNKSALNEAIKKATRPAMFQNPNARPIPKGYHEMPDGKVMADALHKMKCGGKVHKMENGGELPKFGNGDETKWKKQLKQSGSDLLAFAKQKGMTYEKAFKEYDNYWTGDNPTVNSFLALGQPKPYRYASVTLPSEQGGTKVLKVPMYDGDTWKSTAEPTFTKTLTKLSTPSYEQAYENVDKEKYPTLDSFVADAEFYKEYGRNMTPEERAGAVAQSTGRPQVDVVAKGQPQFDVLPNKEEDELPEGFNYWFVEGEKGYLDPEVYGYAKSNKPRQLSQPGINKGRLKRQMEKYAETGEYPWGQYKFQDGGMIVDPNGQWAHPGKNTRIESDRITMKGVNYPVVGVGSTGETQMMMPDGEYLFTNSEYVDEYPLMQKGGESKCPEGYVFYNGQCVKWQEPEIIETDKNTGYNAATGEISQDTRPGSIENNGWWTEHEKYHHLQNLGGGMSTAGFLGQRPNNIVASDQAMGNYYNRRDTELEAQTDAMIKADPNLQFIPRNKLQGFTEGFPGANALMYQDPTTVEGEARVREKQFKKDAISMFPKKQNGGYIDVELNDNEVEQYKARGYIIEEYSDGGITGGTEYDSRYGFMGKLAYDKSFRGQRDRSTMHNLSGDIYGGDFGLGISSGHRFGSENRNFPAFTFADNTVGYDKTRGTYFDFKGGADIHLLDDRYKGKVDITPYGGVFAQSKASEQSMDQNDLASNIGLQYGLNARYQKDLGGGKFEAFAGIAGSPSLGKMLSEEKSSSGKVEFAPQFNIGANYTLPLKKDKMKAAVAKQKAKEAEFLAAEQREAESLERRSQFTQPTINETEFVKGSYKFGGEVMELTDDEIQKLRAGGAIVVEY